MTSPVLEARQRRWERRLALSSPLGPLEALLSITLRLPSPLRGSGAYDAAAKRLLEDLAAAAVEAGLSCSREEFRAGADGPEGFIVLSAEPRRAKEFALSFEGSHPWGELTDVDVMGSGGKVVGREGLGLGPRPCLICGDQAALCVVERRHSLEELRARAEAILLRSPARSTGERP